VHMLTCQGYSYSVFNLVYETNVASCRIWDALGFKRIGRVKGCGNLKSYPGELVDAIIYGRDLSHEDDFVSEDRFDKIRFYLKNGKYPNGADRAEKSRLRSAATHYKLTPSKDEEPEKLWLKGKEVIADPQKQYEIARDLHHKSHGGINKTTALIAELYHWIRIKETVSQVIRNCPECSEMNKGLSAMRQNQNQNSARYSQPSNGGSPVTPTPPSDHYSHVQSSAPAPQDSPSDQLKMEQARQQNSFQAYAQHGDFSLPVDPALMEGISQGSNLANLPPSPFLHADKQSDGISQVGGFDHNVSAQQVQGGNTQTTSTGEELRRSLDQVAGYSNPQ
jgi:hypothetical protein